MINSDSNSYYQRQFCPGCFLESKDAVLEVHSEPRAEDVSFGEHGDFLSGYSKHRSFFSYFRCPACSLLFCPQYFNAKQLETLYGSQPENMADAPLEARIQTQKAYYDLFKKYHELSGEYLEIGADIGLFTKFCTNDSVERFYLYEPNRSVHNELSQCVKGKNYEIITNNYSKDQIPEATLSTVVIIHCLDHVMDPRQLLKDIYFNLKQGGAILIVTHDESSFLARILKKRWPPFTLQHPHLFRPATIRYLLEAEGFEVLKVEKTVNYFPVTHFIKAGLMTLGLGFIPIPKFRKWIIPVKLGNIATIARKL